MHQAMCQASHRVLHRMQPGSRPALAGVRPGGGPALRGFGFVELLACLAIAAILATVVLPGLRTAWVRARRAEAIDALGRLQLDQERFHLERGRYATDLAELQGVAGNGVPPAHYSLRVFGTAPDAYVAEALASGAQRADRADCQRLAVDQLGERSPPAASGCWR